MLVDLDYFFAQAEEIRNPSIRDKPVVVGVYSGRTEDSGAVSTANYIARKHGVKSGMPIILAKRKLEGVEAVFLPVDYSFYEDVSNEVMHILRRYADNFEQVGIDEAYLDVSQKIAGDFEKAKNLAQHIKSEIKTQQKLLCSIGIGPNKLIAKIASDIQKPDGLTMITPKQVTDFLSPLPVGSLIGVGIKTRERMEELGIKTIGNLAKYDIQKLISIFGRNFGTYFHNASLGIDNEPVREEDEVKSISRISTLKEDTRDLNHILEKIQQLCNDIHSSLVLQGLRFETVGIVAVMTDMSIRSRYKTLENPTSEIGTLRETVEELFGKFINESPLELRRVGVKVSGLVKEQKNQKQITSFLNSAKD
jgi:DNA polymerase IV (DinB-like DNA polymerase)